MIEYEYKYKHFQLFAGPQKIIIELCKDNMFKQTSYSAKSNLLFFDNDETWGHAAGVGRNEQEALNMCIGEIENYTGHNIDKSLITEINLPKKIVYIYKNQTAILFVEQVDNNFSIFTPNGRKDIITDNIIKYISKNPKEFLNVRVDSCSEELFKMYNFCKPFDAMTKKYIPHISNKK